MRPALSLMLICSAVVVAGCGGGGGDERLTKDEYLTQVHAIQASMSDRESALEDSEPRSVKAAAELSDRFADFFNDLAQRFDKLAPPEEVEESHRRLVESIRGYADLLQDLADKIGLAPASKLAETADQLNNLDPSKTPAGRELTAAIAELEAKGYTIGAEAGG
jgi:hypothetical protein